MATHMQASDGKPGVFLGIVTGYAFLVAVISLIAYRVTSVWRAHCVLMALLLAVPLWFVSPKKRRLALTGWLVATGTIFLTTLSIRFLNTPPRVQTIEQSQVLNFLLGGIVAKAIVSIAGSVALSTILVLLPLLAVMYISSEWVLHMPEVGDLARRDIIRLFLAIFFHTGRPYYLVENGKITQTKPKGLLPKIGGPGLVIIKPYNAVVFEQGGKVTRIEGPGRVLTRFMEFPKEVLDLRKQWISWTAENVLTKDHVPLRFYCGVGFRIEAARDTAKRLSGPLSEEEGGQFLGIISGDYKVYQHTLYRATYGPTAAGWKLTSQAATESQLLNVVRQYALEDFYQLEEGKLVANESILDTIIKETFRRASSISSSWGVTISGFKISHFEAPAEMKEELLKMWATRYGLILEASAKKRAAVIQAAGEKQAMVTRGEGRARSIANIGRVRAKAIKGLIDQWLRSMQEAEKAELDPVIIQRFALVVEQIFRNMAEDNLAALYYIEVLEKFALSDAEKTIVVSNTLPEPMSPVLRSRGIQ